ncbi:MAG: winged helix DNA-binding protein [Armatimonadetes bacterium]|nr:winged helix DNA-binding protein [Armatimonadota bacterium]
MSQSPDKMEITGWQLVEGVWGFLNVVFDHACPVLDKHGLHQKSLVLLALLNVADTAQELARLLRTPSSSLSYLLKEMEEKGLIERTIDARDKRKFRFVRTPKGDAAHEAGRDAINAAVAERFAALSDDEQRTLKAALPLLHRLQ